MTPGLGGLMKGALAQRQPMQLSPLQTVTPKRALQPEQNQYAQTPSPELLAMHMGQPPRDVFDQVGRGSNPQQGLAALFNFQDPFAAQNVSSGQGQESSGADEQSQPEKENDGPGFPWVKVGKLKGEPTQEDLDRQELNRAKQEYLDLVKSNKAAADADFAAYKSGELSSEEYAARRKARREEMERVGEYYSELQFPEYEDPRNEE